MDLLITKIKEKDNGNGDGNNMPQRDLDSWLWSNNIMYTLLHVLFLQYKGEIFSYQIKRYSCQFNRTFEYNNILSNHILYTLLYRNKYI